MIIKKIEIENFRNFTKLEMPLSKRVNLIIGNNGAGKTAILDAISIGLGAVYSYLPNVNGNFFKKTDLRVSQGKVAKSTKVKIFNESGIAWERVLRQNSATKVEKSLGLKILNSYLDSEVLKKNAMNENFTMPLFTYYGVSRAILDIPMSRKGFQKLSSRFEALTGSLEAVSRFKKAFIWFYNKENEELRLQKESGNFNVTLKELDVVKNAITIVFPDLRDPHIKLNPLRFLVKKNEEILSLDQLSDGYKTMLGLILDLSSRMAMANPQLQNPLSSEAVVMIDEVDLHLHPDWQKRVLNDLLKTFPNTQFIITTHSPFIVESLNNHIKKYQIDSNYNILESEKKRFNGIVALNPDEVSSFCISDNILEDTLDKETSLIDDKLLGYFNEINILYDEMRDLEWNSNFNDKDQN